MILVTGGTGLVGSHLLYRLRESELPVNAIYRSKKSIDKTRAVFKSYGKDEDRWMDTINWIKADLLDLPSLEIAMTGITRIYHCAAIIESPSFQLMKDVNVTGTQYLVDLAIANNIEKFCYLSSIATLGNPVDKKAIDEDDFFNPDALNSNYAISKYGGEMEVWRASQEGLSIIIVNPGIILGEGDYHSGSGQLFSSTYHKQPFYTNGTSGFIDVVDVVSLITKLMDGLVEGERFILVAENISFHHLLCSMASSLGTRAPFIQLHKWTLILGYLILKIPRLLGIIKGISRPQIKSMTSSTEYSSLKIKTIFDYKFNSIDRCIDRVALHFLNQKK